MKYCPYCGADVLNGSVSFCAECGEALNGTIKGKKAKKEKKRKKQTRNLIKKKLSLRLLKKLMKLNQSQLPILISGMTDTMMMFSLSMM